jgi:hypothetical protein
MARSGRVDAHSESVTSLPYLVGYGSIAWLAK